MMSAVCLGGRRWERRRRGSCRKGPGRLHRGVEPRLKWRELNKKLARGLGRIAFVRKGRGRRGLRCRGFRTIVDQGRMVVPREQRSQAVKGKRTLTTVCFLDLK